MTDQVSTPEVVLEPLKFMLAIKVGDELIETLLQHRDPEIAGYALQSILSSVPPDVKAAMDRYQQALDQQGAVNIMRGTGAGAAMEMLSTLLGGGMPKRSGRPRVQIIPIDPESGPDAIKDAIAKLGRVMSGNPEQIEATQNPIDEESMRASARSLLDEIESIDPDKI